MKYYYLVNRFNLGEKCDALIGELKKASDDLGRTYEVLCPNTPEEARALTARFRDTRAVVTAVGGDGSVNYVLNSLVGTDNILSFVPVGTGNDFYRTCAQTLADGIHEVDLIRVNDRYAINAVCFGIDADIANDDRFIHNARIPKSLRYHSSVLWHFLGFRKGRVLEICWGDETIVRECTTVVAANARYYGGGYKISPGSVIDDGAMEIYIVDKLGRAAAARIILSMKKGGHLRNPALRMIQTDKVTVRCSEAFRANIDGEVMEADRFEMEMVSGGIRLAFDHAFAKRFLKF